MLSIIVELNKLIERFLVSLGGIFLRIASSSFKALIEAISNASKDKNEEN